MKSERAIKPCPFCVGKVNAGLSKNFDVSLVFYNCLNKDCGAVISFNNCSANTMPMTTDKYFNRRASD